MAVVAHVVVPGITAEQYDRCRRPRRDGTAWPDGAPDPAGWFSVLATSVFTTLDAASREGSFPGHADPQRAHVRQ
jgi:hypothetical protein